ncbi:lipoprotein, putative [Oceanicola granulosus HTCC2516]|uniref:Lipoprotein, putative n=1 Tax=Oceanicola granulosus (strain ATCC BAA-861 / DSM 15982 / KCTC 12143 / HTCC2516) TaxID=314256 RepID=Q2CG57_OCEGH|nr:hypothetical protein [Oceanicola granulosus]EAR51672.1 lipoprotein, putative [Oceanicola granulosus HTCC2516]
MRPLPALVGLALLAACAAPVPPGELVLDVSEVETGAAPGQSKAFFSDYPDRLFYAAAEACTAPGQEIVRPDRSHLRCESLPPVDAAAALILEFDGTVENLPRFVISFASEAADDGGFLVTADNYIRVPQQAGGLRIIRLADSQMGRMMKDVMLRAGGQPL